MTVLGCSSPIENPLIHDYDRLAKAVAQQYAGKNRHTLSPEELKIVGTLETLGYLSAAGPTEKPVGMERNRQLTECERGTHNHDGPCSWRGSI